MGLCIRNRAVAWCHGLGNWFHREVHLMTKTHTHSSTDIVERLLSDDPLPFCPYDRRSPEYWTAPDDKPCAVCGGLNEIDAPNLCRGADTRIMKEAANEIERLRAISANAETARQIEIMACTDALDQLAATARTAVSYVGYANYSEREREALSWIRKKHEELLALAERFEKSKRYACLQAAWQPVDTAPHEERVLLGWYQPDGTWFCETGMASHGWRRHGISNMSRHGAATHWQPLPSPLSRPQSNTGDK